LSEKQLVFIVFVHRLENKSGKLHDSIQFYIIDSNLKIENKIFLEKYLFFIIIEMKGNDIEIKRSSILTCSVLSHYIDEGIIPSRFESRTHYLKGIHDGEFFHKNITQ